jgi:RimJ/RimL family protein N-acetyltransferase
MRGLSFDLPICTERLRLRPLQLGDAEAIFGLFNNWNVVRFLSSPPWPYTREDAEGFVSQVVQRTADDVARGAEIPLAITLKGTLIGGIGPRLRDASPMQRGAGPNIGFWLGEPFWGYGYMTEAARGLIRQVFTWWDSDAIYCGAFAENAASLRVQEKLGFVRDSETMLHAKPRGGEFPHVNTVLTRERFQSLGEARP